ncbi:hypothetical protein O0L34_g10706 [Tuta absoluta]|nr:hypothetical protein O0L34_g10706 [Tuta absoluta]
MRCSVPNCTNDTKRTPIGQGISFHQFPKEPNLRSSWVEALDMSAWEPKERSMICSEHFRNEDLCVTKSGLRKIRHGAVPISDQSLEDLDAPATSRVCRICLTMNVKMYNLQEFDLDQAFEQLMGSIPTAEDRLPQKICWECAGRLLNCSRFKVKALTSHGLMTDLLCTRQYISIRDIKSIDRTYNNLKSTLITKCSDVNDCDVLVHDDVTCDVLVHDDVTCDVLVDDQVKTEDEDEELKEEEKFEEVVDSGGDITVAPIEVEIKCERACEQTEIYFEEFPDHFESDDDRKLSEVVVEKKDKTKSKEKKFKKKKKLEKLERKVRVKKKEAKIEEDDEDPSTTMDKYKNSDVKRRKTQDGLDESLFTITALTYEEQIAEIEKRQESTNYRTAPYKCTICYRGFLNRDRYDAHLVRHTEASGAYECFICKTRLKTGRALRKHLTAQHTEKFSCKGCPFVTRNRGVAREHEKWHAGAKYQCPHCPSEFDKLTTYMGHIRIKHVSDFVCELCGYTFVSKKGIDVHKKKKHRLDDKLVPEDGPFCSVCEVRFISEEAHTRHLKLSSRHSSDNDPNRIRNDSQSMNADKNGRVMRKIERRPVIHPRDPRDPGGPEPTGPVTCEQCNIQLRDLRLYAQHFRRAHPDKNRTKYPAMKTPCMCEQCGRIFQSMALLKDHMWVHTGEKRFKCDRCDKSFTQKTNLVFHMRVHSNARPSYECPLCGKHFAFFNNRRRHMFVSILSTSRAGVPHEGPQLRVSLVRETLRILQQQETTHVSPAELVFHMRVHSYECPLCGKHFAFFNNRRRHMFVTPAELVFHMRVHSYECPLCGKHFNNRKRHMFVSILSTSRAGVPHEGPQLRVSLVRETLQQQETTHVSPAELVFHMRVHSYECPLCGKHFNNRRRHMFVSVLSTSRAGVPHEGPQLRVSLVRETLQQQETTHVSPAELVFHMRVHSYECPLCGKHFAFFNNRRRHMFIHTGLKPFKCDTCGKAFTTSGEQRAHVEHVHLKKPWPKRARAHRQPWDKQGHHMED